MFEEVIVCLDGSVLAEKMIPLARCLTQAASGKLRLLRVFQDPAEIAEEEEHLRDCARQYGAQLRIAVSSDPASAIRGALVSEPRAVPALATHGRTAWGEAIMGSIALQVLREALRPVLLFRPQEQDWKVSTRIATVAAALDGSGFSEKILPHAVRAARALSARLLLLQALPEHRRQTSLSPQQRADIVESSYLCRKAAELKNAQGLEPQWDVLHGEPAEAICRYIKDMPETLLAMTTHARPAAERLVVGSVAGYCVRHAGVPLLLFWATQRKTDQRR